MSLPDGAASIFVVATRISVLDAVGAVDPGANTFSTTTLAKASITPVMETGDDIVNKNAAGDLGAWAKHPDMIKYYTVAIDLVTPDPYLEQVFCGGTVYTDNTAALGLPTGLVATAQANLGTLSSATYGYRVTQWNAYGESAATNESSVVVTGPTGTVVLSGAVMAATALGIRVYGRVLGVEQLLGQYVNIGTQATSASSGTASPTTLTVTATTQPIPLGYTFQLASDTNSPKITFTTTAFAPVGTTTLQVSVSQAITTTITASNLVPVFVDTGVLTPTTGFPTADTTAGPGPAGYQTTALGVVGNPNGVSLEFWSKAIVSGFQQPVYPYLRWVLPKVTGGHIQPRDLTNANAATLMEGQAYGNPNWSTGPTGDWKYDSTKAYQRARCGSTVLPVATFNPTAVPASL